MYLKQYLDEISADNIFVGRELKQCLDQVIRDLASDEYYLDENEVEKRINFIEKFIKHTKSPFFGKPFILMLWQKAFIEAVFGVKSKKDGYRKFKKIILLIARKNGKSTFCSAIALSEMMLGCGGIDIVCSSNDDNQAKIIYDEINNMREQSKSISKRVSKNISKIYYRKKKSTITRLSDKTQNKEGRNIDVGILDESNEMKDNVIGKSIEQSQSTKEEPLFINITTEGFVVGGYLDEELKYARECLDDTREDPSLLAWLYTQDSEQEIWQNPQSWQKSNPSLYVSKKVTYLERELLKAKSSTKNRVFTLAKDFNIKQNTASAWLLYEDFHNEETYNLEDYRGCFGIGAIDLSKTTDLTNCKVTLIRPSDKKKIVISKYFIPQAKAEVKLNTTNLTNKEKKDYITWAKEGLVNINDGIEVDHHEITKWLLYLYHTYNITVIKGGYDKWSSKSLIEDLEKTFGKNIWEDVLQNFNVLDNPMNVLEADFKKHNIIYNNNEIDEWCFSNTATILNNRGQQMPIKVQADQRIDGAVTLIITYCILIKYKDEIYRANRIEV